MGTEGLQMKQSTAKAPAKKGKIVRLSALVFVLALIAAACGSSGDSATIDLSDDGLSAPAPEVDAPEVSSERVNFSYDDFDGNRHELTDFAGQPVVLNFFASWCPTCIAELPDFETVSQNFAGDVQFVGLSVQDAPEASLALLAETGVTFPNGLDTPGDVFTQFGGLGMPTTVFITADGEVANVHTGVLTEDSLTAAIEADLLP